jgi:hypothetical protein
MRLQPVRNDVVVKPKPGGGREMYVIRRSAGPDQILMPGRAAAIAHALAFAEFAQICAWIRDDAGGRVLLGNFRDAAPGVVMATERGVRSVAF